MSAFTVAPAAEEDIFQIWRYLLWQAGLETANRIEGEILQAFADLAESPGKGHRRSDLTKYDVRFYALYQYMVVYRVGAKLEIVAVLHGKRNVKKILKARM